ncbi:S-adenosyl-L-methionine-dependent methyltransferase [Irpex rosettiformis]|uniref:S-adenosyl-L-methionine-dependent methyltransferase n=1 Tax=Irpex rosettiformis TaxID=378272 RepID=A0ACB8ULZ9_9APHY|nr:S-adenosyl-L-methionine-dependent methyltransferase [Irpex rosettiformis]
MIPTPDLSHLKREDYDHVYEPAEDTFILLDALEQDASELRELTPRVCLEIGPGSGCVTSFVGSILGTSCLYLTSDINAHASLCALRTGRQNKVVVDPVTANLVDPFRSRLYRNVDLLIFNPPYVLTDELEVVDAQEQGGIAGAWAGGTIGMQVTDVVLDQLDELLSPTGRFYLVAVKQNDVHNLQRRVQEKFNVQSEVVLQRRAGREHLFVVRFMR